jgi:YHS domain-containing protein
MKTSVQGDDSQYPKTACGGILKDTTNFPVAFYNDRKVYFCNFACLEAYLKHPDAFMAGEIEHPKPGALGTS